jgi:hypothetical protein
MLQGTQRYLCGLVKQPATKTYGSRRERDRSDQLHVSAALPHQKLSKCTELGAGRDVKRLGPGAAEESASSYNASNFERHQVPVLTVAQKDIRFLC